MTSPISRGNILHTVAGRALTLNNRYRYTNQDVYPRPTSSISLGSCTPKAHQRLINNDSR